MIDHNSDSAQPSPSLYTSKRSRLKDRLLGPFRLFRNALNSHFGRSPQQLDLVYALFILAILQAIQMLLNFNYFHLLIYNLIRLFMTIFCIVSFYTFIHLMYGKQFNLNDKNVYFMFATCFCGEFFTQFLVFNTPNDGIDTSTHVASTESIFFCADQTRFSIEPLSSKNNIDSTAQHIIVVAVIFAATSYYTNNSFRKNLWLCAAISLTRFYGSVAFAATLPVSFCVYLTYVCSLTGVFFSFYLNHLLSSPSSSFNESEAAAAATTSSNFSSNSILNAPNEDDYRNYSKTAGFSLKATNSIRKSIQSLINISSLAANDENKLKNSKSFLDTLSDRLAYGFTRSVGCEANAVKMPPPPPSPSTASVVKNSRRLKTSKSAYLLSSRRRTSLPTIPSEKSCEKRTLLKEVQRILVELLEQQDHSSNDYTTRGLQSIQHLLCQLDEQLNVVVSRSDLYHLNLHTTPQNTAAIRSSNFCTYSSSAKGGCKVSSLIDAAAADKAQNDSFMSDDEENEGKENSTMTAAGGAVGDGNPRPVKQKSRRSLPTILRRGVMPGIAAFSSNHSQPGNHEIMMQHLNNIYISVSGCGNSSKSSSKVEASSTNMQNAIGDNMQITILCDAERSESGSTLCNRYEDEENYSGNGTGKNDNKTSDYESGESPTNSDYNSDTDKLKESQHKKMADSQILNHYHEIQSAKPLDQIKEDIVAGNNSRKISYPYELSKRIWKPEEVSKIEILERIYDWSFPIFQLYEISSQNILSHMAYKIFAQVGLFKSFNIPVEPFIEFFTSLESGYLDLAYHNKIHAADVLHACYYFTTQGVPNFAQIPTPTYKFLTKQRQALNIALNSPKYKPLSEAISYGCLVSNFNPLEILALYCAAAMHDYEHPGRSNQFLIAINSPLAILYNDKSVLENYHASASWKLLKSNEKHNFLCNLEPAEWKKFRYLILENILATDLSRHFDLIEQFNTKVNKNRNNSVSWPLDWNDESERLLAAQIILKISDINSPLKQKELHLQWTNRIVEEFYDQGDEELSRDMPISPYMDRKQPLVTKLQESFIRALVGPLCNAYNASGIMPSVLVKTNEDTVKNETTHVFYSEVMNNFKVNYEMWSEKLKQEQNE